MATNYKSTISAIGDEVALVLRHDNLDSRIYQWIGMAYGDMLQRFPIEFFQELVTETIADTDTSEAFTTQDTIGTPMAVVIKDASNYLWMPQYRSPIDYSRMIAGSTDADSTKPNVWTIMQDATPEDAFFIWPGASGALLAHIFHMAPGLASPPVGTDYLANIPYHFEDVVIWGAAMFGAFILRKEIYPIYQQEYEEAILGLGAILGYKPDATPVFRSINGPYAGTVPMNVGARFPETIS